MSVILSTLPNKTIKYRFVRGKRISLSDICISGHYLQTLTALKILCISVTPFSLARLSSLRKEGKSAVLDFLHARYCRSLCFACAHFVPRSPDFVRPKIRLMNLCYKQVHFCQQVRHRQQRNRTGLTERNAPCEGKPRFSRTSDFKTVHGVYLSETILNCFFGRVAKC